MAVRPIARTRNGFHHAQPLIHICSQNAHSTGLEMCTELLDGYSANGYCGASLNTKECGFDGGDCCECDCIPERANEVSSTGVLCLLHGILGLNVLKAENAFAGQNVSSTPDACPIMPGLA